jgi:hypothetical protein
MTGICDGTTRGSKIQMWRDKNFNWCSDKCSNTEGCTSFLLGDGYHMYDGTCELYKGKPSKADGNAGWKCYVGGWKVKIGTTKFTKAKTAVKKTTNYSKQPVRSTYSAPPEGDNSGTIAYLIF